MPHNGPAIKVGCVTRRKHRQDPETLAQKMVTVQGGYGTCFCSHGIILFGAGAIAVQTKVRPLLSHGTEFGSKALVQYRGTNLIEATSQVTVQKFAAGR